MGYVFSLESFWIVCSRCIWYDKMNETGEIVPDAFRHDLSSKQIPDACSFHCRLLVLHIFPNKFRNFIFQLPFVETSRYFYVILLSGKISIFFLLFCILIISLMEKCLHSSRIFIKFWTKWNTWSKPHLHLKRNAFSHCAIFCIVRHVSCVR